MLDSIVIKEILRSFAGTFLGIFFAGFLWLVKSAYEKHKAEVFALERYERMFANNLTLLVDNFKFMQSWIEALESDRGFRVNFGQFVTNEKETYKISNLILIRKILGLNYQLRRMNLDLNNLYKGYWEGIGYINPMSDEQQRNYNLKMFHKNILETLKKMQNNKEPIKENLIDVVATIRVVANIRFHSLFGYVNFLFKDIFPKMSKKSIDFEIEVLKKNILEKDYEGLNVPK